MTRLTPREMRLVLLAGILYAAIAIPVGIRRGGDLEAHFTAARLGVEGLPLYARPPRVGVWWPPLAVLLVVPFALAAQLSAAVAKGAWAAGSVACLGWSIARLPRDRWKPVALAAAAVAVPLHRNFEDLNLNAVLLALLVAPACGLGRGREGPAEGLGRGLRRARHRGTSGGSGLTDRVGALLRVRAARVDRRAAAAAARAGVVYLPPPRRRRHIRDRDGLVPLGAQRRV